MLNGHELVKEDFYTGIDQPGVFLEKDGFRKYIQKLEGKFRTENRYLSYIDYSVRFRRAMDLQVNQFVKAINTALHSSIRSLAKVGCFSLSLCITPKYGFNPFPSIFPYNSFKMIE